MVEIYAAPASRANEMFYHERIYPYLNSQRRERIDSFLHVEDALRSLSGEWLTKLVLSEKLHLNLFDINFEYAKKGKPFYNTPSGLHFNISHSEDWAVCAFSAMSVGVDIEIIKPIDLSIAKDCFTQTEFETLSQLADESEKLNYFYNIWTIKESYLKAIGSGFSKAPDSFGAEIINNQILFSGDVEKGYFFKQYDFDNGYKLCACSLERQFCDDIKIRIPK